MDYQRILIFMGLAVTGYLLMLAWQEDYGHQATRTQVESSTTGTVDAFPSAPAATSPRATRTQVTSSQRARHDEPHVARTSPPEAR